LTHQEAKNALDALGATHLYGRHLVLEWAKEEETVDEMREKTAKKYSKETPMKKQRVEMEGEDLEDY
jgi:multiple RNA-binding domain-containing protein 1